MDTAKENKLYESVKNDFYQKYKTNIENGDYHEKDLARLRADTNHDWAKAFYKHGFGSYDKTVSIIHEVLLWRKEFDANNLLTPGKLPFPQEFLQRGSCYFRNEDINCNPLLHFVVRLHRKDQMPYAAVCRYIAYHFELAYMFNDTDPIVLLFDMSEAGYANLDMDMIKFVVSCLKTYYPGLIDYMVIFQMPFIFNAAWKIIKNWLPPEGVKLIKFCDKKSIREYIQESQLFVHMGGTDAYKYAYDPKNYVLTGETRGVRPFLSSKSFYSPSMPQIAASSTSSTKMSSDSGYGSSVKSGSSTANSDTAAASKSSGSEDAASRSSIEANSTSSSNEKNNSKAASINGNAPVVNGTTKNNTPSDNKPQKVQPQQSVERQMSNKYSFKSIVSNIPEAQQQPQQTAVNSANNNTIHTVDLSKSEVNFTLSEDSPTSKPKLANNNNINDETKPTSEKVVSEPKNKSPKTNGRPPNGFVSSISYDVRKATELSFENTLATPLLSISPGDEVVFNVTDGKSDVVQFIKLTNTSGLSLAYKIKITSPDKFRVKPGTGIIQTSSCASIMISFLKEFHMTNTGNRDKFLILWTPIEEQIVQQSELNEFWKQAMQKKTNINEHKIKCVIIRPQMNSTAAVTASNVESSTKSSHHKSQIHHAGSKLNQVLGETIMKDDKSINAEQMSKNEAHLTSTKIYNLELNMNCVLDNQNRLMRQQSMMTCLIFFLILLNLIQLLFHSNFFNQFVEPFIDDLFFTKS